MCTDFCKGATTTCEGVVDWVTNTYATPYSRHIEGGAGTDATGLPHEQFQACHDTCMGWVYWKQPGSVQHDYSERFFKGYIIGDSLNCRYYHLQMASGIPTNPYGLPSSESESAARHCQHITPDGGWICTDYRNDDGKTPGQLYKENMFTKHRLGDCWLAADDKIADCHHKGLNDATVDQQLLWLPDDIEYIFMNDNALTKVPDLSRFTELKGVTFENCAISELESDDFASNTNLEIINLCNNVIRELPGDLLTNNVNLKAFHFTYNYIEAVPPTLFSTTSDIEMIAFVGNFIGELQAGTFDGLTKLKLLAIGDQGGFVRPTLSEDSIPDGIFDDLISLEYFSCFLNGIDVLKASMFGDWSANVECADVFQMKGSSPATPLVVEDGVFDLLPSLIDFATYSSGNVVSPKDVKKNPNIKTMLYGDQLDILTPLPEPDLVNPSLLGQLSFENPFNAPPPVEASRMTDNGIVEDVMDGNE